MNARKFFSFTFIFVLVISMTACSLPGSTPTPTPTPTPASPGGSTDCDNPLWPIIAGAGWSYESSGSDFGTYSFTSTIIEQGTAQFLLQNVYSTGVIANQSWQCDAGDLSTLTVNMGLSATVSTINGTNSQIQTTDSDGMTLPASVSAEDTWTQTLTLSGTTTTAGGQSGTAEGTFFTAAGAIGTETVEVPAGTFAAMRIEQQTTYMLNITVEGMTVPVTIGNFAVLWYAPGVGLVKVVNTNDIMGTETIVLTGYNIP